MTPPSQQPIAPAAPPTSEPRGSFAYEHTDIPAGLTIGQWRRATPPRRARRVARCLSLLASAPSLRGWQR